MGEALYELKEFLEHEIMKTVENSRANGNMDPVELDCLDKAVDIIKDISTIEAMEDYGDDNFSGNYPQQRSMRNSYEGQSSRRRARSTTTGRYMSRDNDPYYDSGYSNGESNMNMRDGRR